MRSTRSYLARPMSDISYVDEDTLSPTAISGGNHHHGGHRRTSGANNNAANANKTASAGMMHHRGVGGLHHSSLVTDSSNSAFIPVPTTNNTGSGPGANQAQYLKVEGTSYRVHRNNNSAANHAANNSAAGAAQGGGGHFKNRDSLQSRYSTDAQTQSAESSFVAAAATNTPTLHYQPNSEDLPDSISQETSLPVPLPAGNPAAHQALAVAGHPPPCVQIVSSSPSPQPPPRVASPLLIQPVSASPVPAGTAVTVQHAGGALQTHLLPSPIYGFGYDPSYCQYLGQGVDGFQYELVRRPSIGPPPPPVELLLPAAASPVPHAAPPPPHISGRRPSGGIPYLAPNSMQGSFDSMGPPANIAAPTPIFIQPQQQPLSPRHLHHGSAPQAPPPSSHSPAPSSAASATPLHRSSVAANPNDWGPTGNANSAASAANDIPKLIHETSI